MGQWSTTSTSSTNSKPRRWVILGLAAAAAAVAVGAIVPGEYERTAQASVSPAAEAAVPVTVNLLAPQTVNPFAEFSGRINAVDYAEIRPQVTGRIVEIRFHDGQRVNQGDILFVIDPRPYEAAVAKAPGRSDHGTATTRNLPRSRASAEASSSRPARCRRKPMTSAPMPTRWHKPQFNRPKRR